MEDTLKVANMISDAACAAAKHDFADDVDGLATHMKFFAKCYNVQMEAERKIKELIDA